MLDVQSTEGTVKVEAPRHKKARRRNTGRGHRGWRFNPAHPRRLGPSTCCRRNQACGCPQPLQNAKIAGIKLCESYNRQYGCDFRSVMPTNLYGPGNNYHPENSHVLPAMIRRFHEAKLADAPAVVIWGTGSPKREFLYVDDMASACVHVMGLPRETYAAHTEVTTSHINVGSGEDLSIAELASLVSEVVGYQGAIRYDTSKPDGTPRKLLDISRIRQLGWTPRMTLRARRGARLRRFLQRGARSLLRSSPTASIPSMTTGSSVSLIPARHGRRAGLCDRGGQPAARAAARS